MAMDAKDGYIVIRNSQLLCGNLCKNAMGGTKGGVLFVLIRDHGCVVRVKAVCWREGWAGLYDLNLLLDDMQTCSLHFGETFVSFSF